MDRTSAFFRIGVPLLGVIGFTAICVLLGYFVHPGAGVGVGVAGIIAVSIWFFKPRGNPHDEEYWENHGNTPKE